MVCIKIKKLDSDWIRTNLVFRAGWPPEDTLENWKKKSFIKIIYKLSIIIIKLLLNNKLFVLFLNYLFLNWFSC